MKLEIIPRFSTVAAIRKMLKITRMVFLFIALALISTTGQAAVVRPTIFSDLNSPDTTQVLQSQQANQNGQQQQQSSHLYTAPLADGPQTPSTKINPYKSRFCTALNGERIDAPLGLQTLAIDDLALSASSYSNEQVGPHLARLNLDIAGGAWCPVKPISGSNFGKEWIQARLNKSFVVNAIETQGRFGMGNGKEFVPSYQVEYSRNGGQSWHKWKDFRGSSLLRANEDVNSAVKNELSPPIVGANVIRILPYSQHLRTVCLRFELHGCPYDEGAPIAYATNDGVVEPRWGHLIDYTYDGIRQRGILSNGLGQLVDGVKGHDNFSHNNGFEWVGWKSMNGDVVIEFTFKTLRNFTGALFHSNNLFSSGVEVFQGVDVHYGVDVSLSMDALKDSLHEQRRRDALLRTGRQSAAELGVEQLGNPNQATLWSSDVLNIEYEPDKKVENSRPVTVHLKQRLANKLRFVLKFASKWILVSEVEFLSHPVELMSLATISDQHTPTLMAALTPAKTYDEYVAILREHQLRRIATNAYLESFESPLAQNGSSSVTSGSSSINSGSGTTTNSINYASNDQASEPSSSSSPVSSSDRYPYEDYLVSGVSARGEPMAGKRVTGPVIPANPGLVWPNAPTMSDLPSGAPSTLNPILNQVVPFSPLAPPIYPPPISNEFGGAQLTSGSDLINQKDSSSSSSANERRTVGLATVISFVLVSILVFIGAMFAISSYRLRDKSKLGSPALPRHYLSSPADKGGLISGGVGGLHNFMSVFSSANQHPNDNHYNAIFATGINHQQQRGSTNEASVRAASTLKRLATLAGGEQKSAHPLLNQQQQPGQLLVSVKESSPGGQLFGGQLGNAKSQVNTQLIVGLNQVNPLAQQQIYNNSSNMNCSNQTYATHYSNSMSMASSSTTGHQGDYADYAIPDAQPMIPALVPTGHSSHSHVHHQQQHQHLNHAFNGSSSQHQLKQPFSYQTELRASHRAQHQTSLIQPQVIQQQHRLAEHNYELIYNQDQTRTRPEVLHNRTLSNQLSSCQPQAPFSSMTLSHNRFHELGAKRALPMAGEKCSPGGSSSQSCATTATTSVSSGASSGHVTDLTGPTSHYYYASNEK